MASAFDRFAKMYQAAYDAQLRRAAQEADFILRRQAEQERREQFDRTLREAARKFDLQQKIAEADAAIRQDQNRRAQEEANYKRQLWFDSAEIGRIREARGRKLDAIDTTQKAEMLALIKSLARRGEIDSANALAQKHGFGVSFEFDPTRNKVGVMSGDKLLGYLLAPAGMESAPMPPPPQPSTNNFMPEPSFAPTPPVSGQRPDDPLRLQLRFPARQDVPQSFAPENDMELLNKLLDFGLMTPSENRP